MRMMTKLLALMLALMLTACTALAEDADQLSDIQSKGEIVVATEGAWAPWIPLPNHLFREHIQ